MKRTILELFNDDQIIKKIQTKLPELFHRAELESSRAGRVGMEVGSIRERILVSLLIYRFGKENVETEIPITEPEMDVKLFNTPISIKTKTGSGFSGVKLTWTVDAQNAKEFLKSYTPFCDMIFAQIVWGKIGHLYYFPLTVQKCILNDIGRDVYIKLPKLGTNPRGIEIRSEALKLIAEHKYSRKIEINWQKKETQFNAFERWVELWEKD